MVGTSNHRKPITAHIKKLIGKYEHRLEAINTIIYLPSSKKAFYKFHRILAGLRNRLSKMYS